MLITEVSIGTSVMTFVLRAIGTTLGCLWGYIAIEARGGNRFVCAIIILIGLFPCAYVQLGTKYPKAGMVAIVSICVVALSFELQTVPGKLTNIIRCSHHERRLTFCRNRHGDLPETLDCFHNRWLCCLARRGCTPSCKSAHSPGRVTCHHHPPNQ